MPLFVVRTFVTDQSVSFFFPQRSVDATTIVLILNPLDKCLEPIMLTVIVYNVLECLQCGEHQLLSSNIDCLYVVLTGLTVQCRRRVQFTLVLC